MATKLKQQQTTTNQQLLHSTFSLATVLIYTTYLLYQRNWKSIGSFRSSLLVPIVLIGEILKAKSNLLSRRHSGGGGGNGSSSRLKQFSIRGLLGSLMLQLFCTLLYSFACIIFGAPVLKNFEETFILSILLTLLTVSPTVFLLGGSGTLQACFCEKIDFSTENDEAKLKVCRYNALGCIIGAWAGSLVAPLDWDREWQVYPIPNVVGALLGVALSNICLIISSLYVKGKMLTIKKRS